MDEDLTISEARAIGRSMAGNAARAARRPSPFSRDEMIVTAVNGDRLDLNNGNEEHPIPVTGVPMTTACAGVRVGDSVIVDTYMNRPLAVGVRLRSGSGNVRLFTGTMVLNANGTQGLMWTSQDFIDQFGEAPSTGRYFIGVMNGDGGAYGAHVEGAMYVEGDGILAAFDRHVAGRIRVNYLVAIGGQ